MSKTIRLDLPWPPSINHYWRHSNNRHFISNEGRSYRETVFYICSKYRNTFTENSKISVNIEAFPPDKRKRDLDNVLKSLLDALQHAGIYSDDYNIDRLSIERKTALNGKVLVELKDISQNSGTSSS